MTQRIACLLASLILVPLAAAGPDDFLSSSALYDAGLVRFWQLELPLAPGQSITDAYRVDDQLYLATGDGYVHAIHAFTGTLRWVREVTTGGYRIRRPCHAGDRVIFVTTPMVYQFNRYYGDPVMAFGLRFPSASAPVADDEKYYFGGLNHRFYAFRLDDDFDAWRAGVRAPVVSRGALLNSTLFMASMEGRVYACTAANKRLHWQSAPMGPVSADLVADENGVYVASQDQSLYLLDLDYGEVRWRARFGSPLFERPFVTRNVAFQASEYDGLVAIETAVIGVDERIRWRFPAGRGALTADKQYVYVLTNQDTIAQVSIDKGQLVREVPASGMTLGMPATDETAVYLASPDGRVLCARPRGTPTPTAEQVRQALLPPSPKPAGEQPATAAKPPPPPPIEPGDVLTSGSTNVVGGKSKVSRDWTGTKPAGGAAPAGSGAPAGSAPSGGGAGGKDAKPAPADKDAGGKDDKPDKGDKKP